MLCTADRDLLWRSFLTGKRRCKEGLAGTCCCCCLGLEGELGLHTRVHVSQLLLAKGLSAQ